MQTTIVKLYSDGKLANSVAVGDLDETEARRCLVEHVQEDSPEYTATLFRTQIVNRHRYVFAFLEPYRIDFVRFVNNLLQLPVVTNHSHQGDQQ